MIGPGHRRATVIKVPGLGPGILIIDGQQCPFVVEGLWQSPIAPALNHLLDVEVAEDGQIVRLTVVDTGFTASAAVQASPALPALPAGDAARPSPTPVAALRVLVGVPDGRPARGLKVAFAAAWILGAACMTEFSVHHYWSHNVSWLIHDWYVWLLPALAEVVACQWAARVYTSLRRIAFVALLAAVAGSSLGAVIGHVILGQEVYFRVFSWMGLPTAVLALAWIGSRITHRGLALFLGSAVGFLLPASLGLLVDIGIGGPLWLNSYGNKAEAIVVGALTAAMVFTMVRTLPKENKP